MTGRGGEVPLSVQSLSSALGDVRAWSVWNNPVVPITPLRSTRAAAAAAPVGALAARQRRVSVASSVADPAHGGGGGGGGGGEAPDPYEVGALPLPRPGGPVTAAQGTDEWYDVSGTSSHDMRRLAEPLAVVQPALGDDVLLGTAEVTPAARGRYRGWTGGDWGGGG